MSISSYISRRKNKKGEYNLLPMIDGYKFNHHGSDPTHFKCNRCGVMIYATLKDGAYTEYKNDPKSPSTHSHSQPPSESPREFIETIKDVVKKNLLEPTALIVDTIGNEKINQKRLSSVRREVDREKLKQMKEVIKLIKENPNNVFIEEEELMIFVSKTKLLLLKNRKCSYVLMDGTFSSAPKEWYQLYTLHIMLSNGQNFPLFHCLLKNKKQYLYSLLLEKIQLLFIEILGYSLFDEKIGCMIDFEGSVFNALSIYGCPVHGCYFHFCQALWRRINSVGLKEYFVIGTDEHKLLKHLFYLPHLKPTDIRIQFKKMFSNVKQNTLRITDSLNDKILDIFCYFKDNWIEKWPIETWCCYKQQIRTDNLSENYHSALKKRIVSTHPSLDKLLIHLNKIEIKTIQRINQMVLSKNHKQKTNMYDAMYSNARINYYSGVTTIDEFFASLMEVDEMKKINNYFELGENIEVDLDTRNWKLIDIDESTNEMVLDNAIDLRKRSSKKRKEKKPKKKKKLDSD